jgi:two-component system OmpR family sensor kinase
MTLRRRLTLGVIAIVMGCLTAAFAAVYAGTGGAVRTQLDGDLRGDMDAFNRVLQGVGAGGVGVRAAAEAFVAGQPYAPNSRLLYARLADGAVVTNDEDLTVASPGAEASAASAILRRPPGAQDVLLPDGAQIRLLVRRVPTDGGLVTVGVGESTRLVDRAQDGVLRSFLAAGVLAALLAAAAATVLSHRIARPLRRMAGVAARIEEGELDPRMTPNVRGDGAEVTILAEAFDSMLDRLQAAFDRQNAFVADASHELRTPLTVIRGQLEVLALDPHPSAAEVRRVDGLVRIEVERMGRMVEDLLVLAHAQDAGFLRLSPVAVPELTAGLLEAQRATADRDFRHEARVRGILMADPDRMAQAIRNLLRNATEHTREGGLVLLWVDHDGTDLLIGVDDDGPGIPEAERRRVFDRFHRAHAHGPRGTSTGSGLGLAIVQAIADAHGGTVEASRAPAGGARLTMTLPGFGADAPKTR